MDGMCPRKEERGVKREGGSFRLFYQFRTSDWPRRLSQALKQSLSSAQGWFSRCWGEITAVQAARQVQPNSSGLIQEIDHKQSISLTASKTGLISEQDDVLDWWETPLGLPCTVLSWLEPGQHRRPGRQILIWNALRTPACDDVMAAPLDPNKGCKHHEEVELPYLGKATLWMHFTAGILKPL